MYFQQILKALVTVNYLKEMVFENPGSHYKQRVETTTFIYICFKNTENRSSKKYDSVEINTSDMKIVNANKRLNDNTYLLTGETDCVNKPLVLYNLKIKRDLHVS